MNGGARQIDIVTERLALSRPQLDDLAESAALWSDPEVARFTSARTPQNIEQSWWRLLRNAGHWALMGCGTWMMRQRSDSRYVGELGIKLYRRDAARPWDGLPEIGFVLSSWAHGQGFATEAALAALAWTDAHFDWPLVMCMVDPENAASLRVAAKCGFVETARITYHNEPAVMLVRRRGAARAAPDAAEAAIARRTSPE